MGKTGGKNGVAPIQVVYSGEEKVGLGEKSPHDPPEYVRNCRKISFLGFKSTINLDTVPLKITLFLYFGAMAAILPYLTIHMLAIGISISEAAIIYGILPFTSFIGPPLIGFLADKLGQYKTVLIIATFLNAFFHTMLLAVPFYSKASIEGAATFHYDYSNNEILLSPQSAQDCGSFMEYMTTLNNTLIPTTFSNCSSNQDFEWPEPFLSTTTEASIFSQEKAISASETCFLQNFYDGNVFFSCGSDGGKLLKNTENAVSLALSFLGSCSAKISNVRVNVENATRISCQTNLTYETGREIEYGSNALTFWLYFLIRIVATIFMNSCFCLLDATTLAVVKKQPKAEYGSERIWTVLGTAAISPLAGLLVDLMSRGQVQTDYSAAFYVANVLFFFNIVAYFIIKLEVDKPEENILHDGLQLFKYPEVAVFLVMIFLMGNMWGFVESYLFVFLKDELHAPNYLLGLTLTTGSLAGIPFLYGSERIVNKVGRVNLIVIAFVFYFIRFIGYSFVESPWWCFPFEAMEAFTYHLMWTAAATYCSILAPKGLLATLMGIMGALHYSLGKGFGSFLGGYLIKLAHVREAFRYFGVAAGIFAVIYFLLNIFWLKKTVKRRNLKLAVAGDNKPSFPQIDANANRSPKNGPRLFRDEGEASEAMLPLPT